MANDFKYESELERMKQLLRRQVVATLISASGTASGAAFVIISAANRDPAGIALSPVYAAYFSTILSNSIRDMRKTFHKIRRLGDR